MNFRTTKKIITKQVLNEKTGELEMKDFVELTKYKKLQSGYNLMYSNMFFDMLKNVLKSKEVEVIVWVTKQFTYKRIEANLSYSICSVNISKPHFMKILRTLVKYGYLMRISKGIYRLNPFMYIPYRANASELQKEWLYLEKQNKLLEKQNEQNELQNNIIELRKKMYE